MKNSFLLLLFLFLSLPLLAQNYNYNNLEIDYKTHQGAAESYTFKNLRLYPVRAKSGFLNESKDLGKFTTLKEALEAKKIEITETEGNQQQTINNDPTQLNPEVQNNRNNRQRTIQTQRTNVGGGATVNKLFVKNISKDTIFILAGEVIQGGRQDRVVAQDIIIAPNTQPMELPVFCVEKGRWSYKNGESMQGFAKYYGNTSMTLRGVIDKNKNQQAVWDNVAKENEKSNLQTNTGAYTIRGNSEDFKKSKDEYEKYFTNLFAQDQNVIGVVVVTGNRVAGCDLFASPALFQSHYSSLLDAYIHEAISNGETVKIEQKNVEGYVDKLLQDETEQKLFIEKNGKLYENKARKLHISTY